MKRRMFFWVTFMVTLSVNAQSLLPEKGNLGIEIGFKPFSESTTINLIDNSIKLRYFLTDYDALRLRVGFNWGQTRETTSSINRNKSGYSNYDLSLGYEHHWGVSDRIDLYAGAQAGSSRLLAFYYDASGNKYETTDNNGHFSGWQFMGGVFTGIDVYLWKRLYCGAEIGLALEQTKENQSSYTFAPTAHTYTTAGFYCEPAIRLGWTF